MPRIRRDGDHRVFYEGTRAKDDRPGPDVLFLVPFGRWWVATHAPHGAQLRDVMDFALDTGNWAFRCAEGEWILGAGAHHWEAPRGFVRWLPGPFIICFFVC